MADQPGMGRCGIGPAFGKAMLGYALAAWLLTYIRPDLFQLRVVPRKWLLLLGSALVGWGTWLYVRALRILRQARAEGKLATTGPFARVRHPIYAIWMLLLVPGAGLTLRSWLVLTAPLVGYISFRILIPREEAQLAHTYGDEFRAYCRTRNRVLPIPRGLGAADPPVGSRDDRPVTDDSNTHVQGEEEA